MPAHARTCSRICSRTCSVLAFPSRANLHHGPPQGPDSVANGCPAGPVWVIWPTKPGRKHNKKPCFRALEASGPICQHTYPAVCQAVASTCWCPVAAGSQTDAPRYEFASAKSFFSTSSPCTSGWETQANTVCHHRAKFQDICSTMKKPCLSRVVPAVCGCPKPSSNR